MLHPLLRRHLVLALFVQVADAKWELQRKSFHESTNLPRTRRIAVDARITERDTARKIERLFPDIWTAHLPFHCTRCKQTARRRLSDRRHFQPHLSDQHTLRHTVMKIELLTNVTTQPRHQHRHWNSTFGHCCVDRKLRTNTGIQVRRTIITAVANTNFATLAA